MRFPQGRSCRGSQKWIQEAVNSNPPNLDDFIRAKLPELTAIQWQSPLKDDDYAEYRDASFLKRIGLEHLSPELKEFWPDRGPQWDALARFDALAPFDKGGVLLVEAKAHIGELCSSSAGAEGASLSKIKDALSETAEFIDARPRVPWTDCFYQLANRLAHLYFLHNHGVSAKLVLTNFVGDSDIGGPGSPEEWRAAYQIVWHVLGIPARHKLLADIIEIFPDVRKVPWTGPRATDAALAHPEA
jgi:hypothetical protein